LLLNPCCNDDENSTGLRLADTQNPLFAMNDLNLHIERISVNYFFRLVRQNIVSSDVARIPIVPNEHAATSLLNLLRLKTFAILAS
jgi:hypothetical protein